ncbi:MAG: DUF6882 domain-containing protein [Saezia sp.]
MRTQFFPFFDQHIGTAFARQLAFAKFLSVKEEPSIDLEKGRVEFSNGQKYAIELLGTQLEDNTFLWAWAQENESIFQNNSFKGPFPQALLQTALEFKQWGEEHHVEIFSHPQHVLELSAVPLVPDEFNGDHIACLAAGLKNKAYWRDTHDEGIVYYLIGNTPEEVNTLHSAPHILETIEQVTSYFETDNKCMVESFLQQQNFIIEWETQQNEDDEEDVTVCYATRGAEEITATFDEEGFLTEIEAHGFEGEEDYQETQDTESDLDGFLGSWGEGSPTFEDSEFPPKSTYDQITAPYCIERTIRKTHQRNTCGGRKGKYPA